MGITFSEAQELYIFWFLHQTTTEEMKIVLNFRCISFDSYIKPQLGSISPLKGTVVYLLIPTSNHNPATRTIVAELLYIFWFLHQTTTRTWLQRLLTRCISFDSYIKPQPNSFLWCIGCVVYLLIPTSNHNHRARLVNVRKLYIFWFLHQTTTIAMSKSEPCALYIFWFLHQTTTCGVLW